MPQFLRRKGRAMSRHLSVSCELALPLKIEIKSSPAKSRAKRGEQNEGNFSADGNPLPFLFSWSRDVTLFVGKKRRGDKLPLSPLSLVIALRQDEMLQNPTTYGRLYCLDIRDQR